MALFHTTPGWDLGFIIVVLSAVLYAVHRFKSRRLFQLADKIPGPKGWPLVGNLFELSGSPNGKMYYHLKKKNPMWGTNFKNRSYRNSAWWTTKSIFRPKYTADRNLSAKNVHLSNISRHKNNEFNTILTIFLHSYISTMSMQF